VRFDLHLAGCVGLAGGVLGHGRVGAAVVGQGGGDGEGGDAARRAVVGIVAEAVGQRVAVLEPQHARLWAAFHAAAQVDGLALVYLCVTRGVVKVFFCLRERTSIWRN